MTVRIPFDNSFAKLPDRFFARTQPDRASSPEVLLYNQGLGDQLGVEFDTHADLAQVLSGNVIAEGSDPIAQAYAGHQFGNFVPSLGDGRAILLGEVLRGADRFDIQLKGSGRTPFSRGGDGRAWLGPVLREYIVSEAMHALGIPTTRALAVVATGDEIMRDGPKPGAILTRVASSHLRVGTFQYFAARRDTEALRTLFDYARARHYPDVDTPADFLRAVAARQADLIARWMGVGFIHGVMNTDNCHVGGITIDYGPCAFVDRYHPMTVYSSIDHYGRYAYGAQPDIIVWNLAQLATSLVPLAEDTEAAVEEFTQIIRAMPDQIQTNWRAVFGRKIGIADISADQEWLITEFLNILAQDGADFTNSFRALGAEDARAQFNDPAAFDAWAAKWKSFAPSADLMNSVNPAVIPRNHRIEQAIQAAVTGDLSPAVRLISALATPYTETDADLSLPPRDAEVVQATFCGT